MSDFDRAFVTVVGLEGGYVNNPADPGGETKFGISKRSYPDLDIVNLTVDQAKAIYLAKYWTPASCDSLPWPVNCLLFEVDVNTGAGTGNRLLQAALHVAADGIIGPGTERAAQLADRRELVARFQALLGVHYASLPGAGQFLEGWLYRAFLAEEEVFGG